MTSRSIQILTAALLLSSSIVLAESRILVYEHQDFRGHHREIRGPISDLDDLRFDDKISSIRIIEGSWEMCRNDNFDRCQPILNGHTGEIRDLVPINWNDRISSIRPINETDNPPSQGRPGRRPEAKPTVDRYSIDGRGVLALSDRVDIWYNKATLQLSGTGSFTLSLKSREQQTIKGSWKWEESDVISVVITEGPGRGEGTIYLEGDKLHSVEIWGDRDYDEFYTVSFINYEFAPWNQ